MRSSYNLDENDSTFILSFVIEIAYS